MTQEEKDIINRKKATDLGFKRALEAEERDKKWKMNETLRFWILELPISIICSLIMLVVLAIVLILGTPIAFLYLKTKKPMRTVINDQGYYIEVPWE